MINWNEFTVSNRAITDLRELLFLSVFNDPDIELTVTTKTGVRNGSKLGLIDSMGDVGMNHRGCAPDYSNIQITGLEKEWALGAWEIAKHICYTELEDTIAEDSLNTGTERAYLEDTPYWDIVLMPLLQRAIKEMFWRIVWFGDVDAANITDGGVITDGVELGLFNMCDGLWKRLQAIIAENTAQQTVIAANSAATLAEQKTALRASGVAVGIFDDMLSEADSRIFDKTDACILCTNSLYKALRNDLVDKYGKYNMPIEQIAAGIHISEYDGVKLVVLDIWDRLIKKYESDGEKLNCPHRAVVCSPSNLFVGTNDRDKIASLRVTFNDETNFNNIYAASMLGTLIGEDALVQVAI